MAEDVRAVLPQLHEEHPKQHGLEAAAVAEHDLYLERGFILITVVGQVSAFYVHTRSSVLQYLRIKGRKGALQMLRVRKCIEKYSSNHNIFI